MDRAKQHWKANTVRFNLGQPMLDNKSALFKRRASNGKSWGQNYLRNLKNAVKLARQKNMVVVLAVFNYDRLVAANNVYVGKRSINKYDKKSGEPTGRTKRAVQRLATAFKRDNEVLLEVYNEPWGNNTRYVMGDKSQGLPGVNDIVAAARKRGKKNPIIVQGLGADLSSLPYGKLTDKKLIFSSHAFLGDGNRKGDGDANWGRLFGKAAKTRPVMLTAWNAVGKPKKDKKTNKVTNTWCRDHGPQLASDFITYVEHRKIGLHGFAFDVRYSMTKDFMKPAKRDVPTKLKATRTANGRWKCEGGGGELIKSLFTRYAS